MPSKRCIEDEGQPCRGATLPKNGKGAQASTPTSPDHTNRNPNNLAPAARGRYKPNARWEGSCLRLLALPPHLTGGSRTIRCCCYRRDFALLGSHQFPLLKVALCLRA